MISHEDHQANLRQIWRVLDTRNHEEFAQGSPLPSYDDEVRYATPTYATAQFDTPAIIDLTMESDTEETADPDALEDLGSTSSTNSEDPELHRDGSSTLATQLLPTMIEHNPMTWRAWGVYVMHRNPLRSYPLGGPTYRHYRDYVRDWYVARIARLDDFAFNESLFSQIINDN